MSSISFVSSGISSALLLTPRESRLGRDPRRAKTEGLDPIVPSSRWRYAYVVIWRTKWFVMFAMAALLLVSLAVPAHADSQVFHGTFNGVHADATLSASDGCFDTYVSLLIDKGRFREGNGAPTDATELAMEITKYDHCTGRLISDAFALTRNVPDSAFQADTKLASAILDTNVQLEDADTLATFVVAVHVTWTGTGEVFTEHTHDRQVLNEGSYIYLANSNESSRDATADGSVIGTTTVVSGPALAGGLALVHFGVIDLTKT